jgi:hypothetical protein
VSGDSGLATQRRSREVGDFSNRRWRSGRFSRGRLVCAAYNRHLRRRPIAASVGTSSASLTLVTIARQGSSALNRRKSNISPLVSARIRPTRRPPFGGAPGGSTRGLRITRDDKPADRSPPPTEIRDISNEIGEVRRTAETLRNADEALGRVHELLKGLAGLLLVAKENRRRRPGASAGLQQVIDSTLDAVDAIIQAAQGGDGGQFLEGDWGTRAGSGRKGTGGERRHARAMSGRGEAGNSGGFLAMLRSRGAKSLDRCEPAEVLAIVDENAAKIAGQRKELTAFLDEKVLPLLSTLEVTDENIRSNQTVQGDADFAVSAGQITGGDVLINACRLDGPKTGSGLEANPSASGFTIHHGDGE